MGEAFDSEIESKHIDADANSRLAVWVPDCMTTQ